jgi:alkylhydroperoxidase family enzyme
MAFGQKVGLTQEQLDAIDNFQNSDAFDDLQKLALQFAEDSTERVEVEESVLRELKTRLSEQELVELSLMVGLANLTNRFSEAFKPEFL